MKEVKLFYSNERTARIALEKLIKDNTVYKIRNGLYTCRSGENGGPVANRFQIASAINESSFVSHHTAFEYYGITDQVFYDVYVSSNSRFHDFEFDGYRYHFIKSRISKGISNVQLSGGIRITDKERTIIDSLRDINLIAGLEEVLECVRSMRFIDEKKMLDYLAAYNKMFLYQKVGFVFSLYKEELGISNEFIAECKKHVGNSKRYISNGIVYGVYSRDWKLIYPRNIKEMKNGIIEDANI
jgi:predicted transcriptional regulator of viral defense system